MPQLSHMTLTEFAVEGLSTVRLPLIVDQSLLTRSVDFFFHSVSLNSGMSVETVPGFWVQRGSWRWSRG